MLLLLVLVSAQVTANTAFYLCVVSEFVFGLSLIGKHGYGGFVHTFLPDPLFHEDAKFTRWERLEVKVTDVGEKPY